MEQVPITIQGVYYCKVVDIPSTLRWDFEKAFSGFFKPMEPGSGFGWFAIFFPLGFCKSNQKADFMNNKHAQCVCFLVATEEDDDDGFSMHIFPPRSSLR